VAGAFVRNTGAAGSRGIPEQDCFALLNCADRQHEPTTRCGDRSEVTTLLRAWNGGDADAFERVLPLVCEELHRMAARYLVASIESGSATTSGTAGWFRRFQPDYGRSVPQVHSHTDHRAARIDEDCWLTESRAEQIVGRQALLRGLIERVEHIHDELDSPYAADVDRSRKTKIEQRLRR